MWQLLAASIPLGMFFFGTFLGEHFGEHEAEMRHIRERCSCKSTEACLFGPGIVGIRTCTALGIWGACDPDPAYRKVPPP